MYSKTQEVGNSYSFLWKKNTGLMKIRHFERIERDLGIKLPGKGASLEVGCGKGKDISYMAEKYPGMYFIGMDLSEGVNVAKQATSETKNVSLIRGSILEPPFKEKSFDFLYSYGVLHHTIDPEKAFSNFIKLGKDNATALVYLYEDHSDRPARKFLLNLVNILRHITIRMPKKLLWILCMFMSPVMFLIFGAPSKILRLFKSTGKIADILPYNFAYSPFSVATDLYDRFATPIECRYSKEQIVKLFEKNGMKNIKVDRLKDIAGWVAWGVIS